MASPIRILVTGAGGNIAYSLLYSIANGDLFGPNQPVSLHLLEIPVMVKVLEGVAMELRDCAFPLLRDVVCTSKEEEAFTGIDAAFLVGAMPRRQGMERKDLLAANVEIFKSQGKALNTFAKKTVKVLVVGNPANTNALICSKYAPSIPKENFSAMTRLDHNRAIYQISDTLKVPVTDVSNVIIWGNHSNTQYPDFNHAIVNKDGVTSRVSDAIGDKDGFTENFIKTVQQRGAVIIDARKLSSAMSAAKAAVDHMRDWFHGTPEGRFVSMAVYSDGSYNAPPDVMYSFPVTISSDRTWKIVQGLTLDDRSVEKMALTSKELLEEKEVALAVCAD